MWITLEKQKPENEQMILFKCKGQKIPEVGVWQEFPNGICEVYIFANDDVELPENIEKWMPIPE